MLTTHSRMFGATRTRILTRTRDSQLQDTALRILRQCPALLRHRRRKRSSRLRCGTTASRAAHITPTFPAVLKAGNRFRHSRLKTALSPAEQRTRHNRLDNFLGAEYAHENYF